MNVMPDGPVARSKPGLGGHVHELAVAEIAEEQHRIVQRNGEIVQPVAVEVAHGAGHGVAGGLEAGGCGVQVFKAAVVAAVQHANGLRAGLHQHQVHAARAGHVHHAGAAGGGEGLGRFSGASRDRATRCTGIMARLAGSGSSTGVTVE